jgi:hypothetical protein
MGNDSVKLQPPIQGVQQVNLNAPEPKEHLELRKGQIQPLPAGKHGFASIDNSQIKNQLRFNRLEGDSENNAGQTAKAKTDRIHDIAFVTGRTGELPSLKKFWKDFKTKVGDSAVGRFVQRNILHHVANTKINSLDLKTTASADRKTTLQFELKAQKPNRENVSMVESDSQGHTIEVTFDRLRNKRSWYNPMRWIGNDHRTGKVGDILAKLQVDVARQVRLRNLGIGLKQEQGFAIENSGLLSALPESTPKKGVKPPNVLDYSKEELKSLKTAAKELGEEKKWGHLLDKAIDSRAPKAAKLSKIELVQLRKIALTVEVEKLQAITEVCGDYAFTDQQIKDLNKLSTLLVADKSAELEEAIPSLATSLREMSIMAWSAMSPVPGNKESDSYNLNLERLLAGKQHRILPLGLLMSPCFMSPHALRAQAENLERYAAKLEGRENLTNKLGALEQQFQDAGHGSQESQKKVEGLQARATEIKQSLLNAARDCRSIAESSAGRYRFQGMLPILAGANSDQLQSFLKQKLVNDFQATVGLQPANVVGQLGADAVGGALMVATAFKGNVGSAAVLGATTLLAHEYFKNDDAKYQERFQGLTDAILNGIASGSEEQLIQANRLIGEEKCDKAVQKWAGKQHDDVTKHSQNIGNQEDIKGCNTLLSSLAANEKLTRKADAEEIRTFLDTKIQSLAALEVKIKKTNQTIDKGPDTKVTIHDKLTVEQVKAQEDIQRTLVNAGESVDSECKALKGSFEILQSAYPKKDHENGLYFNKIEKVETSIENSIKNWKIEGDSGIEDGIAEIRSDLSKDASKLTNEHATHMHDLAGHLETAANKAKDLKATMLQVGRGLASPTTDYLNGSLDRNVFEEGARFVTAGQFSFDIKKLDQAMLAVGVQGKNPYALFRDDENSRKAISEPLGKLITDAKKTLKSWEICHSLSSAMVAAAQAKSNIHELKSTLNNADKQLKVESYDLQKISDQYKGLHPDGPAFNFEKNIKNLHETSLRAGTARLVGLSEVPPPDSCHAALDLLSGPLADPDLHESVARYLEKTENRQNKAEALKTLFSALPVAGKSPVDWTTDDTTLWKEKLRSTSDGLQFLGKLFDYSNGEADLNSALKTAKMISAGDTQKSMVADLYSAPIHRFLDHASKNENLKTIFPNEFQSGNLNPLFQKLATKVDLLVEYGLAEDLKSKATQVGKLVKSFNAEGGRAELNEPDFEILLKFSKVLADLQASPEATRQHKVRLAALDLLSNVDESFKTLQDPKDANLEKLKSAFTPQPQDLESWEKFKDTYQKTIKEYQKLKSFVDNQTVLQSGKVKDFEHLGGNVSLLKTTEKDVINRRDNLLQAHKLFSGAAMAKFQASSELAKKPKVLAKQEATNELKNFNHDLLRWTNVDTWQEDIQLKKLDSKIETEQSEANTFLQFRAGQSGIYNEVRQQFSLDVSQHLAKFGMRPNAEERLDTVNRLFLKGGDLISKRLDALRDYLANEQLIKEYTPRLEAAQLAVEKSSTERDKLLGEHQSIVFKNAVRAEILRYCVEDGINPGTLVKDPHEQVIKNRLSTLGWSDKSNPAGLDIPQFFQEAKTEGFLETWKSEAGNMRSDLARIEGQIDQALKTLKDSLASLSQEIVNATSVRVTAMREEGKDLSREGSVLLASAKAHASNLVGDQTPINARSLAVNPLRQLCQRLEESHPDKKEKIVKWETATINKINISADWESISNAVISDLDKLHDELLDCAPASRPPYFESLVANRALEFDRAGVQEITQVHNATVGKVEAEIFIMEALRKECDLLPVKVALPKEIVADSNAKPRTWVRNFFDKNKATISSNKDFGNSQNAKALAAHFNSMPALKFLELFKEGADLHQFFSAGEEQNSKEFANLISHMAKLRNGLESMANKLSSYEGNSFKDFDVSKQFAPPGSNQKIEGNNDLRSIGNILKDHSLPDGVRQFQELVANTKISIHSENQYNKTVYQLEVDLIRKKEVQDDEDMESQRAEDDYDLSEAGGADEDFKLDIQENPPQSALSSIPIDPRIQQQIDAFQNEPVLQTQVVWQKSSNTTTTQQAQPSNLNSPASIAGASVQRVGAQGVSSVANVQRQNLDNPGVNCYFNVALQGAAAMVKNLDVLGNEMAEFQKFVKGEQVNGKAMRKEVINMRPMTDKNLFRDAEIQNIDSNGHAIEQSDAFDIAGPLVSELMERGVIEPISITQTYRSNGTTSQLHKGDRILQAILPVKLEGNLQKAIDNQMTNIEVHDFQPPNAPNAPKGTYRKNTYLSGEPGRFNVHLQRYDQSKNKDRTPIQNPLNSINLPCMRDNGSIGQISYTPVAFGIHKGDTLSSGHYIHIERDDSGQWWRYDDMSRRGKPEKITQQEAANDAQNAVNIYFKKS